MFYVIHSEDVSLFNVSLRLKVRLVATPFLDWIMEGERVVKVGLGVTFVEFVASLIASARIPRDVDAFPSSARAKFAYHAVGAMAAKMILAWWLILPLNAGASKGDAEEPPLETNQSEEVGMRPVDVQERSVAPNSSGEEGKPQVAVEERPVATKGIENAIERGNLRRNQSERVGSAAVWGEKDDEATRTKL